MADEAKTSADYLGTLSDDQREAVRILITQWLHASETHLLVQRAVATYVNDQITESIQGKLATLMETEPLKLIDQLFRNSGMVVQTKASEKFDAIVARALRMDDTGLMEAVKTYTRMHMPDLIQRAITEIVTQLVLQQLATGYNDLAQASSELIRDAFMNSRNTLMRGY